MRTRILAAFCTVLSLAPLASLRAQEAEGDVEEQQTGETGTLEVTEPPQAPARPGARTSAPGETHTVQSGDTLWDLTQRYLGSPWYWPKVWSYNPEIANPHWIYPGNTVRFYAAGEEVPSRVEVGTQVTGGGDELESPSMLEGLPDDLVTVAGRIGYEGAPSFPVGNEGFVTQREVDAAGRIEASFSESHMLSYPDTVYVRFKQRADARVGDRYSIFRTVQKVQHPVKGGTVGYLTQVLGTLVVTEVGEGLVTAQVQDTNDAVTREDLVGPANEAELTLIRPRPNSRELQGFLVTGMVPYHTIMAEHQRVIIDQGSAAGVEAGNTFTVVRQQDLGGEFLNPAKGQNKELPVEVIASCIVVDVREDTSNCLLTRSIREVVPGDRVEMRVGQEPSARR